MIHYGILSKYYATIVRHGQWRYPIQIFCYNGKTWSMTASYPNVMLPCVILFLCFSVLLALRLPRLGKRECFSIFSICACLDLLVSSSSWCLGRTVVLACGTPWTSLLPCFTMVRHDLWRHPIQMLCYNGKAWSITTHYPNVLSQW